MAMNMMMMMTKDKRDIRPLLVKFGVALAISFAGFLYSRIRTKRIKASDSPPTVVNSDNGRLRIRGHAQQEMDSVPSDTYDKPCIRVSVDSSPMNGSPSLRISGDREGVLLPEFDQLVREFDESTANPVQQEDYEQEIDNLKRNIRFLRERERGLEIQLLEYCGVKEQEALLMELQSRLKINNMEVKLLTMKIKSLQADNSRLEAQAADNSRVVAELEAARAKIKMLKRRIRQEAEQSKEQLLSFRERVSKLQDHEHEACSVGSDVSDAQKSRLETEAKAWKNSNQILQMENADLARRLESTQILANCLLEDPEKEVLAREKVHLIEENETLMKNIEGLKADRCADAEELVYLRWINACLRYELRHYHPPPGKTVARDLSKSLSPRSEAKAKQLILEYANSEGGEKAPSMTDFDFELWPSSNPSYLTDGGDHDDSPRTSSSNKHHKKIKFFSKLRRLIRGKHSHHHHHDHHHQSGQASPIPRSFSVDDIGRRYSSESPRNNSCSDDDQKSELRSPLLASSSQNSNNSAFEHHHLSTLAEEEAKDTESGNRISDSGSSQGGGVRFVLGRSSSSSPLDFRRHDQELDDSEKSELTKYAEVLKESQWLQRTRKKSASFSAG